MAIVTAAIRNNTRVKTTTNTARKRVSAVAGSGYHVGDYVLITNPSANQEKQGEVVRETKDGLLKIKTPKGKIIRRLPKKVRIVDELHN